MEMQLYSRVGTCNKYLFPDYVFPNKHHDLTLCIKQCQKAKKCFYISFLQGVKCHGYMTNVICNYDAVIKDGATWFYGPKKDPSKNSIFSITYQKIQKGRRLFSFMSYIDYLYYSLCLRYSSLPRHGTKWKNIL